MSKSLGNYVGIDEPAKEMFGKLMSISDDLMLRYYELLTDITPGELSRLRHDLSQGNKHPRQVKEDLAKEIVARYHSRAAAEHEAREFIRVLREKEIPEDIEEVVVSKVASHNLPNIMKTAGTAASTSDARRLINQGAVKIDGEKVSDVNLELSPGKTDLLQVGKRRFKKVTLAGE
jgi:tyrosyl-tRNA synthetase